MNKRLIGIFDSGVGGFTVLKVLEKYLPYEKFIYVADNINLPYGEKKPEQIINFSTKIIEWLVSQNVKLIIIACHTSCSAISFEELAQIFPEVKIIGVIQPTIKKIALKTKKIGIIATEATIRSNIFAQELKKLNSQIEVYNMACPKLVPMIENNEINSANMLEVVNFYLQPLIECNIENIIYGCTHYPHLHSIIQKILPNSIKIIDPAVYLYQAVENYLETNNLQNDSNLKQVTNFFVTGEKIKFSKLAELFLDASNFSETRIISPLVFSSQ